MNRETMIATLTLLDYVPYQGRQRQSVLTRSVLTQSALRRGNMLHVVTGVQVYSETCNDGWVERHYLKSDFTYFSDAELEALFNQVQHWLSVY